MGLTIKPNRKKKSSPHDILTQAQLKQIHSVLDRYCVGQTCISRSRLYEEIKGPLGLTIEQYLFEQAITAAIKTGRLKGFETRAGKHGGICRAGAFDDHDRQRKEKVAQRKPRKKYCAVTIDSIKHEVSLKPDKIEQFVVNILQGKKAKKGHIAIDSTEYILPDTINTSKLLKEFVKKHLNE